VNKILIFSYLFLVFCPAAALTTAKLGFPNIGIAMLCFWGCCSFLLLSSILFT
jgi:hypothetical protein